MKKLTILILLLILSSCSREFTDKEHNLLVSNAIDDEVSLKFVSLTEGIEQLYTLDKEYNEVKAQGIIIKVKPETGEKVVRTLRNDFINNSYQAYFYDNNYGYENDEVAVVLSKDDLNYLKIVRTDGINYDLSADDVLEKYMEWKSVYGLKLFGAGRDWLEAEISVENVNWNDLAKEVYEFCPDVVEQGTGTIEALAVEMEKTKTLYLWWD